MHKITLAAALAAFALAATGVASLVTAAEGDASGYHETLGKKKQKKQAPKGSSTGSHSGE